MANLLEDADLWQSIIALNSPPEFWDGSVYFIAQDDGGIGTGGPSDGVELVDPAPAGSTVSGTLNVLSLDITFAPTWYFVVVIDGVVNSFIIESGNTYPFEYDVGTGDSVEIYVSRDGTGGGYQYSYEVEISPITPEPLRPYYVYELDKGWTFDGAYIPHFLELNWYFGDSPTQYHGIQKIRVHGLSKGRSYLTVSLNGMQTDYEPDYTEPQILDLPRNPKVISIDLFPETNYVDTAGRGLSIQMKFEGRNTDIALPEPQHALQVLILQSSPVGTGFDAN